MEWPHKVVLESHFSEVAQSYMKTTKFSFGGAWHRFPWQVWYIQSPLTMLLSLLDMDKGRAPGQFYFSPRPENWLWTRSELYVRHDQREVGPIHFAIFTCLNELPVFLDLIISPQTNSFWNCCLFTSDHDFTSTLNISGVVTWYFCWQSKSRAAQTVRYSVPSEHSAVASLVQRILHVAAG